MKRQSREQSDGRSQRILRLDFSCVARGPVIGDTATSFLPLQTDIGTAFIFDRIDIATLADAEPRGKLSALTEGSSLPKAATMFICPIFMVMLLPKEASKGTVSKRLPQTLGMDRVPPLRKA
jgi:hypothetical protein